MAWDFETPAAVQAKLDWVDEFVRTEVEPLDRVIVEARDLSDPIRQRLIPPLQKIVKEKGLWASHLSEENGGCGIGFVEATLLNEILGRTKCGPVVFGCQSPDAGNAEILAAYATPEQRKQYLEPLVEGAVVSAFAATEPQGGGDPTMYETIAVQDGDEWVINGQKWFITGAGIAEFMIVMVITDPDKARHERMSLFIVPADTPGLEVVRHVHVVGKEVGEHHSYLRFNNLRVPAENMLGKRSEAFKIMQARMGVARLLLAMRALGQLQHGLDMMCERAVSRYTQGSRLADKQLVQAMIAETWMELAQYRLFVLQTAWKLERLGNSKEMRMDISATKSLTGRIIRNTALRGIQIHGSIGVSSEVPFMEMLLDGLTIGIADGPTEVHDVTLARELLKRYEPATGLFPTNHNPRLREEAEARYADVLQDIGD